MCKVVHGEIGVKTRKRFDIVDVTSTISSWLDSVKAVDGVITLFVPHTTAAIAVNEHESGLLQDIVDLLSELTRPNASWRHNRIDNNAHAHLGNVLTGPSVSIPVVKGRLALGTWQSILFIEMDGPRSRRVRITFIGALEE